MISQKARSSGIAVASATMIDRIPAVRRATLDESRPMRGFDAQ
jgi:hypothetical protein